MATHLAPAPTQTRSVAGVRRWAWATLAFFVLVVLEGAVVRATSSGGGCGAHWPLCNGEFLPHHPKLTTIIEFTHRSLTGISTAMFALLIGWTFYATPKRHPARRTSVIAGLLLLSEGALGAILVLKHLVERNTSGARVVMQSVHFTNTLLLLGATAATAVLLGTQRTPTKAGRAIRNASLLAIGATILTGATGSLAALADTLFPSPDLRTALAADFAAHSPLLIRMRWMHPAASALATLATVLLVVALRRGGEGRTATLLLVNLGVQIVVGIADVALLAPVWIQVLHLFSADMFWITLVIIAWPFYSSRTLTQVTAEQTPGHSARHRAI